MKSATFATSPSAPNLHSTQEPALGGATLCLLKGTCYRIHLTEFVGVQLSILSWVVSHSVSTSAWTLENWKLCRISKSHRAIRVTDKFGTWRRDILKHIVGWAPIAFAVVAPCTNLPDGIVLGNVLGWAPIGFAAMATPRPSQYYFGHTYFVRCSYEYI